MDMIPQFVNGSASVVSYGSNGPGFFATSASAHAGTADPPSPLPRNPPRSSPSFVRSLNDSWFRTRNNLGVPQNGESSFFSGRHVSTTQRGAPSPRTASV